MCFCAHLLEFKWPDFFSVLPPRLSGNGNDIDRALCIPSIGFLRVCFVAPTHSLLVCAHSEGEVQTSEKGLTVRGFFSFHSFFLSFFLSVFLSFCLSFFLSVCLSFFLSFFLVNEASQC